MSAGIIAEKEQEEKKVGRLAALKEQLVEAAGISKYGSVSSDELSLEVRTASKEGLYVLGKTFSTIQDINKLLNIPNSVSDKMGATRALDSKQTHETDDFIITWSYHPDSGMPVIYEIKP